jgi:hypothetical protein
MVQTTTLHTTSGEIELSSFTTDGRLTWLEFHELYDEEYPDKNLAWDNEDYLFNIFYPFLHRWKNRICKPEDEIEFKEVWHYLENNEDLVEELIEMFNEALNQKWYNREKL